MAEGLLNAFWRGLLGQTANATTEITSNENEVCRRLILSGMTVSTAGVITVPGLTFGTVTVPGGGTGVVTLTNHGVVLGQGAANVVVTSAGTSGQLLTSNGPAADPTFQTGGVGLLANTGTTSTVLHGNAAGNPSYGAVALGSEVSGTLLGANGGTGSVNVTFAGPTAPRVLTLPDATATVLTSNAAVTVAQGGTGVATLAAHGLLIGNGTGVVAVSGAGTVGQALVSNGAAADPTFQAAATVLDKSTTEQTVVSTAAVTSVYSFAVPANTLGTNRTLRVTLHGKYTNASAGADNLWVRVQWGGTTIAGAVSAGGTLAGPTNSANARVFTLSALISANGATNSQRSSTVVNLGAATATETDWAAPSMATVMQSALALDTTTPLTLDVSVQLGTSSGLISFKRFAVVTELLS